MTDDLTRAAGRVAVITGASSGIGSRPSWAADPDSKKYSEILLRPTAQPG